MLHVAFSGSMPPPVKRSQSVELSNGLAMVSRWDTLIEQKGSAFFKQIPSRELTYPTKREKENHLQSACYGDTLVLGRVQPYASKSHPML